MGCDAQGKFVKNSLEFARDIAKELDRTFKDIVENISEIVNKISLKAGALGDLGLNLEKELRAATEVDGLEHHLVELGKDGAKLVIMVDDLDLGWDNSDVSNELLLGLLAASTYLSSLSENFHVMIFLREDVYSLLMTRTQHSDKYRNVERIRWEVGSLIGLLEQRILFNYERRDAEAPKEDAFYKVFPVTIGTHNTDNWMTERTLSRPRELIQLARTYTEGLESQDPSDSKLKDCETSYSQWKLEDLCSEYTNQFPDLANFFAFWKTSYYRVKYHLSYKEIEDIILDGFIGAVIDQAWFNDLARDTNVDGMLRVLFEIGFIGDFVLGGDGGSKTFYSYAEHHEPRFAEVQVHPCFRKAVGTVDRIRSKKDDRGN